MLGQTGLFKMRDVPDQDVIWVNGEQLADIIGIFCQKLGSILVGHLLSRWVLACLENHFLGEMRQLEWLLLTHFYNIR